MKQSHAFRHEITYVELGTMRFLKWAFVNNLFMCSKHVSCGVMHNLRDYYHSLLCLNMEYHDNGVSELVVEHKPWEKNIRIKLFSLEWNNLVLIGDNLFIMPSWLCHKPIGHAIIRAPCTIVTAGLGNIVCVFLWKIL